MKEITITRYQGGQVPGYIMQSATFLSPLNQLKSIQPSVNHPTSTMSDAKSMADLILFENFIDKQVECKMFKFSQ